MNKNELAMNDNPPCMGNHLSFIQNCPVEQRLKNMPEFTIPSVKMRFQRTLMNKPQYTLSTENTVQKQRQFLNMITL